MSANTPASRPTARVEPASDPTCVRDSSATTTVEPLPARPSGQRARTLRDRLSDRDVSVLRSLAMLRLLAGDQLRRLHVAEGSATTQGRRARALLQRLADLKLVIRLGRRVGGVRAGSAGYVYGLSGHGQAALAIGGPVSGRRRRVWETSPSFADHVLLVAEVYVRLVEAERAGKLELLDFQAEPAAWRRFPGPAGPAAVLKPDAFVRLGVGELEHSVFLEIDRGTESVPTIARKCRTYALYWQSGIEQAEHGVFPRVLWLASDDRGAQRITKALTQVAREAQHLFQVAFLEGAVPVLTATARGGRMA
jgi:hypothetical protein